MITAALAIVYFLPYSQLMEEERPDNDQQQGKGNIGKFGNTFNIHEYGIPSTIRIKFSLKFIYVPIIPFLGTSS